MANITKNFLEEALGDEIEKFEINSGSNLGDGYTSLMYSIDVTQKGGQGVHHHHLLLKCYPSNQGRQNLLTQSNIFQRELSVYDTLIPELKNFQKGHGNPFKNSTSNDDDIIKPPFADFVYGRAIDYKKIPDSESKACLDPLDNCIIMKDLRKNGGFRLADRLVGFDLDHCRLVITAQAKLHGLSWAYKGINKLESLCEKFPFLQGSPFDDMESKMFDAMFEQSHTLFNAALEAAVENPNEQATLVEAVAKARTKVLDVMELYFSSVPRLSDPSIDKDNVLRVIGEVKKNEVPWLTAVHGDSWLNNMMFRYDEETGKPLEVVLVDLQLTREGDPLMDMCYSIFTSTSAEFRKNHMSELLKLYADTFTRICTHFAVPPPSDFSLVELTRRFHRGKAAGFMCCMMGLPTMLNDPKNAIDMDNMAEDATREDVFKRMADTSASIRGNKRFEDRVVGLVRELYAQGVI